MDKEVLNLYTQAFLEENSKVNLISKNDEQFLFEKHITDSLAISKFFEHFSITDLSGKTLLDIGTGGGFPSIPIALEYPQLKVVALDSIRKKINAITNMKSKLNLNNLTPACLRAESLIGETFDFIASRAVAELNILIPYAIPLLKPDGYFIAYKSVKANEEIIASKQILKKFGAEVVTLIEYELPLEKNHTRRLIIIKKKEIM